MNSYCAMIGDINKSRTLPDRRNVQRKFQKAIEIINKEYENEIASKFILTIGDEFQGLLKSPAESYRLVRRFQDLMEPVLFSFGVGIGKLSTPLKPTALGMDGECFHRARSALVEVKKNKRQLLYAFDSKAVDIVNALISLMDKQWKHFTRRQKEITRLMQEYNNQELVAKKLKITQQAVSKAYSSTAIKEIHEAEKALRYFLSSLEQP